MEKYIEDKELAHLIKVDSAGTGAWHVGEPPDSRAAAAAGRRGYDIAAQRARQVNAEDFGDFHYILAMDRTNLKDLKARCPASLQARLSLLLNHGTSEHESVPDPYYSGEDGFELVLDLVEQACAALLQQIIADHGLERRVAQS